MRKEVLYAVFFTQLGGIAYRAYILKQHFAKVFF